MTNTTQTFPSPTPTYVNRQDVDEVCADAVHTIWAEASTVRVEFCVNRLRPADATRPATGVDQVTSARLIMSIPCALTLLNHLKQLEQALVAVGALKVIHTPDTSGMAN